MSSLNVHPRNPRNGNIEIIAESIKQHGFLGGVIAQVSTRNVLVGNHRLQAAQLCKLKTIPVFWVDCSDVEAEKILLVDNRCSDISGYDDKALLALLEEVQLSDGLSGTGYDDDALERLGTEVRQADQIAKVNGADSEWVGMPEFEAYTKSFDVVLHCETIEERDTLEAVLSQHIELNFTGAGKTRSSWYPAKGRTVLGGATLVIEDATVSDLHPEQEPG
ncbi:MAG TPA: ParB N-terminal domain-containing protein [Fimbriimonas sp.]|nr:ParB N-terminal domain-containing protein [Fimbriimonas sp.]